MKERKFVFPHCLFLFESLFIHLLILAKFGEVVPYQAMLVALDNIGYLYFVGFLGVAVFLADDIFIGQELDCKGAYIAVMMILKIVFDIKPLFIIQLIKLFEYLCENLIS